METLIDFMTNKKPAPAFKAEPFYSPEGDSLTYYFKPDRSYAERIDDFLTVYRSTDDKGLVGCQIKGLPKTLALLGNFGIKISDGCVTLGMIFMACMAQTTEPAKEYYLQLGGAAGNVPVPEEALEAMPA